MASDSAYSAAVAGHLPPSESTPLLLTDASPRELVSSAEGEDGWWSELRLLLRYSLPLIATYLLQYSWCVTITFICGHLSADDLAAASLGMTTMNIVGFAIFEGMATALDTLCAQAYGSGSLPGVGLHVQRMLILMAFAAVPIGAIWAASPWILALFVKQRHLAVMGGTFLRVSILGMPGYASFEALKRFLQAQGDFKAAMCILVICTPVNAALSWFFAFNMGLGLAGAALGSALTNNLRPTLLLLYIVSPLGRWSHQCWGGFSRAALSPAKWGPMITLSIAGSAVNLAEWAAFEVVTISTSYLGTEYLAAQTVLTTISIVSWHIPFSVSVGISTRIGHLIGAGLLTTARRATALYGWVFLLIGCIDGAIIFSLRHHLPRLISEDPDVCRIAASAMLVVSVFQVIDSFICFTNGMLRGLGRQSVAAWIATAVNYGAAVPLAVWLELGPPSLGLGGGWIGIGSGMVLIAAVECWYMRVLRWQDCVDGVKLREG
ncbi:putative MATE efflux family protein [Rosellinia necatrix]|uniref:Putative MATE efflux family protein n=1 Tax=Rosellinia necatrix TaxID=77044 RepID=A0A1W2TTG1_ROSNE|nr:putative MATE efflux family protein [Rosellinia necatrix]